jgi:hypothetical protein
LGKNGGEKGDVDSTQPLVPQGQQREMGLGYAKEWQHWVLSSANGQLLDLEEII